MPTPRQRQHVVPRAYLRNWAGTSTYVYVRDVKTGDEFRSNVQNVAVRRYFYSGPREPPGVEEAIADIEAELLPVQSQVLGRARRIYDGDFSFVSHVLTPENKEALAQAIAFQFARSPLVRRLTGIADEVEARRTHIGLIGRGTYDLACQLLKYVWIVGINGTTSPFYTSDNPVIASPPSPDAPDPQTARPADIVFPLSPWCLLWLWDPDSNPDQVPRDGHTVVATQEDVVEANMRQVMMAGRHVVSATDDFAAVRGLPSAW